MGRTRHDWVQIREEFVTSEGNWTLNELAAKHEVSESTLRKKAAKEDWTGQRHKYRTDIEQKRRKKLVEEKAQKLNAIDEHIVDCAEAILLMMYNRLYELQNTDPPAFLQPYELAHYTQNLQALQEISDRARGDIHIAVKILADEGVLDEDLCHQIAQVYERKDGETSEAIAKILQGQGEYPD